MYGEKQRPATAGLEGLRTSLIVQLVELCLEFVFIMANFGKVLYHEKERYAIFGLERLKI